MNQFVAPDLGAQWADLLPYIIVACGGLLVLMSPYTWLEEFTPRDKWLGGRKVDGENVTTLEGLRARLEPGFRMVAEPRDVEFVIRETARKFQHTASHMTVWEKAD